MLSHRRLVSLILLCALPLNWKVLLAQPIRQDRLHEPSIEQSAGALWDFIARAVSESGGDVEKQQVHIVFAFSTGHFNKDPIAAQAAREIAWRVVRDHLIKDDRVSCFAWEMDVWQHLSDGRESSLLLEGSDVASKEVVRNLFPTTVKDGSIGGHDTEQAIVRITGTLGNASDAVIVLLTNDAQSVAPAGMRTIGTDNPVYQQVLQWWKRMPQVNKSGASLELPYQVERVDGTILDRKLDVVVVLPRGAQLPAIQGYTRSEWLKRGRDAVEPPVIPRKPWWRDQWRWLIYGGLLALIVLGVVALGRRLSSQGSSSIPHKLKIRGEQIEVNKVRDGDVICLLVGNKYIHHTDEYPAVVVTDNTDVVVAEIRRRGKNIVVSPIGAELWKINEQFVDKEKGEFMLRVGKELQAGSECRLHFMVREPEKITGPPQIKDVQVKLEFVPMDTSSQQEGTHAGY